LRLKSALTYGSLTHLDLDDLAESGHLTEVGFGASRFEGGVTRVAEVKIQEGESIESALRRFKRKVQQEDIIKDIKKHSFYLKPGDKRRAKQALARKRNRKKLRRELE
jgi:small subunit ribosomal protein S21